MRTPPGCSCQPPQSTRVSPKRRQVSWPLRALRVRAARSRRSPGLSSSAALELASGLAFARLAGAEPPRAGVVESRVESLFVREHEGLFIETRLLTRGRQGRELWALVRFEAAKHGHSGTELTKVPQNMALRAGDIVEVSLAEPKSIASVGPMRVVGQVVRRLAASDTLFAGPATVPRTLGD